MIKDEIRNDRILRNPIWTESIAVGDKDYIGGIKEKFASLAMGRTITMQDDDFRIQEEIEPYSIVFTPEKGFLSLKNGNVFTDYS